MRCNPGFEVNLWYEEEPRSPYFARLADMVKFHKVKPPEEVFGNPVPHYAHKADVLRLQILLEEGGIYLDLDTVTVRPFEPLLNHAVVMSLVKNDGNLFGLGNSVIMASPGSSFLKRWYESYRTFRSRGHDEFYDEHGAGYSYRLAREHPAEITLLDETAFLTPDMTPRGIASLFLSDADYPSAFCHHLWGKNAQDVIESLNEWNVGLYPGLYSRQVQASSATSFSSSVKRARAVRRPRSCRSSPDTPWFMSRPFTRFSADSRIPSLPHRPTPRGVGWSRPPETPISEISGFY